MNIELQDVLAAVLAAAPQQAVYVGWSLGGQLALELAPHSPSGWRSGDRMQQPTFVAEGDWPGMEPAILPDFSEACGDPRLACDALTVCRCGRAAPRRTCGSCEPAADTPGAELLPGLDWLASWISASWLPD